MQIAQGKENRADVILTRGKALILWVVLAIIAADAVAILSVLGMMTAWEAAVALFTVLTVAAGAIWTLLLIPRGRNLKAEDTGASESSPGGTPLSE